MKQIHSALSVAIHAILAIVLISCTDASNKAGENTTDTIGSTTSANKESSMPPYDPALDPWNVEAPFAKRFGDTLGIKMFEVTLKPGDSVGLHRHPDHTLYVVQGGRISITTETGERQEIDLPTGVGFVNPTTTHSGKNIGKTDVRLLVTDIHRARENN